MKLKVLLLSNILLAGALLALPVIADDQASPQDSQPGAREHLAFHGGECRPMDHHEGFVKALALTDDQLEKFADLKNQYDLATANKKAELKSLYWKMHDLMTQPNLDKQELTSVHEKISALHTELSNIRFNYSFERASVLTAVQRKQIRHHMLMHKMMSGHEKHHDFQHHHHDE